MKDITFVDLEVTLNTCRVVDIGAVRSDRTPFHENSFDNLLLFLHQVPYNQKSSRKRETSPVVLHASIVYYFYLLVVNPEQS